MVRFRSIAAWLLVVLWFPATLHCSLEAAEIVKAFACETSDGQNDNDPAHCNSDGCQVVEDGLYRRGAVTLNVAVPPVIVAACFISLQSLGLVAWNELAPTRVGQTAPLELTCTWQFVQRAALLPGAPSLV